MPDKLKTIPVLSFILRHWKLLAAGALLLRLTRSGSAFEVYGSTIYGPGSTFLALLVGLLGRHLFFHQSADADAADGTFVKHWHSLEPLPRTILNVVIVCVFFLGACIVIRLHGPRRRDARPGRTVAGGPGQSTQHHRP